MSDANTPVNADQYGSAGGSLWEMSKSLSDSGPGIGSPSADQSDRPKTKSKKSGAKSIGPVYNKPKGRGRSRGRGKARTIGKRRMKHPIKKRAK